MKLFTKRVTTLITACALLVSLLVPAGYGHASNGALSHLTFSRSVGLPGVVLPAGAYTFQAVRPDVVRVTSRDGRRVFYTGFTHRVPRPRDLDRDALVSLGEAPAGEPMPIRAWYPLPVGTGHQFLYR